jgi:receptor expression-enhancing protein 5/6
MSTVSNDKRTMNKEIHFSLMDEIQKKTDFPAVYVMGALAFCGILVFLGVWEQHLTSVVSIVFPIYWTMKAMERTEKDEDKQWLSYWITWGIFFLLDVMIGNFLVKIPYFYFSKLALLTWMFLPGLNGGMLVWNRFYSRISKQIDLTPITKYIDRFRDRVDDLLNKYFNFDTKSFTKSGDTDLNENNDNFNLNNKNMNKDKDYLKGNPVPKEMNTGEKDNFNANTNYPDFGDLQHESRQNIVSDAKLNEGGKNTNLQDVRNQINQSMDNFRDFRQPQLQPLNQQQLVDEGKRLSVDERTHIEQPMFGAPLYGKGNERVEERIITPHNDKIIFHKDQVDLNDNNQAPKNRTMGTSNLQDERKTL